jgi:hypothetical protein
MNERKDEQWLDEELRKAIGTGKPEFDAEAWKDKHPEAYRALLARGGRDNSDESGVSRCRRFSAGPAGTLAAAAAVIIVAGILLLATRPQMPQRAGPPLVSGALAESPADIVTFMSLTMAYRQGGQEALNRQLDAALETLGPRPDDSLLSDLFADLEG